uniref:MARVEL domain-containing protein n=1 Tax=Mesocestoides corti TaxID=53468 RepID=A0A5K3FCW4_MESCO
MPINTVYFKSFSGLVKLAICLCLIVTLICGAVGCYSYRIFFVIVSVVGFVVEIIFYLFYLLSLTDKIGINWPFADFVSSIVLLALALINFIVACVKAHGSAPQDGASAFFWILMMVLLCIDIFYAYRSWGGGAVRTTNTTGPSFVTNQQPAAQPPYPQDQHQGGFEYQP